MTRRPSSILLAIVLLLFAVAIAEPSPTMTKHANPIHAEG